MHRLAVELAGSGHAGSVLPRIEIPVGGQPSVFDRVTRDLRLTETPIFGDGVPPIVLASSGGGGSDGSILIAVSGGLDTGVFNTPFTIDLPEDDESDSVVVVPLPTPILLSVAGAAAAFAMRRRLLRRG